MQLNDSLKMPPAEMRKLLDQLTRQQGAAPGNRQRRLRVPFERSDVILECDTGGGRMARFKVHSRNISTHGIAVLHGQFMHANRPCAVELPTLDAGAMIRVPGRVVRCRFVTGRVHEVAITFTQPIDLSLFVGLNLMDEVRARTEANTAKPAQAAAEQSLVKGTALIVEPFESNRKLYAFWLKKLGMRVLEATTIEQALDLCAKHSLEVVILDQHLSDGEGAELATGLRCTGYLGMILAVSSDTKPGTVEKVINAGCDHVLPKGFDAETLQRLVLERLHEDAHGSNQDSKIFSSLASDADMKPLIQAFVQTLPSMQDSLRKAVVDARLQEVDQLCINLAEASKGYGFASLAEAGKAASEAAHTTNPRSNDVRRAVQKLLNVLSRCAA